jgi:peptide/nickel transport system permease protein
MLAEAQQLALLSHFPWLLAPGALVILSVLACNLVADAMHEALDPRIRK